MSRGARPSPVYVPDPDTGKERRFSSAREAAAFLGLSPDTVRKRILQERPGFRNAEPRATAHPAGNPEAISHEERSGALVAPVSILERSVSPEDPRWWT